LLLQYQYEMQNLFARPNWIPAAKQVGPYASRTQCG
jgi:hypothetical protein